MPSSAATAVHVLRNRTDVLICTLSPGSTHAVAARFETRTGRAPEIGRLLFHLGAVPAHFRVLHGIGIRLRLLVGGRLRRSAGRPTEQAAHQQTGTGVTRS